ncbi:MAG: GTPase HflX [Treponema sp.]|jgi:GTP-binding protein HflX|nr:GTPase HflX [Treponema sp.]
MKKMYETGERPKRAFLVIFRENSAGLDALSGSAEAESLDRELTGLVETLGLETAGREVVSPRNKQPKFGIGTGKAGELAEKALAAEADCLVLDWNPSPSQQRNWENLAGIPVIDRQELIIRIFSLRAKTKEAELQVKLAELTYSLPRLSHKYIDLSRQRGGSYGTRGAGETRLETDRRLVERRIRQLEKGLEVVRKQRRVQRRQRERQGIPLCAIVGYTNAGKSSLFNALTGAGVFVEDKLFATLDATTRRFEPAPEFPVLLTDTVGFIRRLPHSLIDAFRSTLEEAALADLLIHILDASDSGIGGLHETTLSVLRELGAEGIPVITVLNKIDRLEPAATAGLPARFPGGIPVSVKSGAGLEDLKKRIVSELLSGAGVSKSDILKQP